MSQKTGVCFPGSTLEGDSKLLLKAVVLLLEPLVSLSFINYSDINKAVYLYTLQQLHSMIELSPCKRRHGNALSKAWSPVSEVNIAISDDDEQTCEFAIADIPSIQKNVVVHSQMINDVSTNKDGTSKSSDIPVGFTTRTKDRTNVMPTRMTQSGGLPQYMLTFSLGKLWDLGRCNGAWENCDDYCSDSCKARQRYPEDQESITKSEGDTDGRHKDILSSSLNKNLLNEQDKLETHSKPDSISISVFIGGDRSSDPRVIAEPDMILTTYGVLTAACTNDGENSIFYRVDWYRVVLDEARTIKSSKTLGAQAAFKLSSYCRWCLTGTPLQNKLEDLYNLLCFLHVEPWCN
ncbi:uncharacterized protein LOC113766755 [Coffea eugenioides]|uniref:uncharacterized protein LOC113766755 n=1 Tax=Coffea eugenioides TaxID=49369 RepID=UPI000F6131DD|nr:uncharacterized protein LOC113766755 [Coffea eugenioides]